MNNVVIGVGSNINPEQNVIQAEEEVKSLGKLKRKSDFIYTEPLLFENQSDFLNGVFHLETPHNKFEVDTALKDIENKMGRVRTNNKNGPRTIDLDTVIFNNQIIDYDVFRRDFLKNPIIDLFPKFSNILNCRNYMNNYKEVNQIVEIVKSVLPYNIISIFGAGHWFCDEECKTSDIDFITIVNEVSSEYETLINNELLSKNLNIISGYPVQVRFFWIEELEGKSIGKCIVATDQKLQRLFIRQFPFYKLLYGKPWPISDNLVKTLPIEDEFSYCLDIITNLPCDNFLKNSNLTDPIFDWPDLIKLYLYSRILTEVKFNNYQYDMSFLELQKFVSLRPNDLIHKAIEYRYSDVPVAIPERNEFYSQIKDELINMPL
jgi:2-amino-4-hydroxy-6-hydroxymethyldihydropteridine diphosphokinase